MISSQARFTDPSTPKPNNPGPGYYGTGMVYGNLLKQVGVQRFVAAFHRSDRISPLNIVLSLTGCPATYDNTRSTEVFGQLAI